jgi:hypothetical protein
MVGLAMAMGGLLALSLMLPGPQVCGPGTVTPVTAHARSVPAGRHPACATWQGPPGRERQSRLSPH